MCYENCRIVRTKLIAGEGWLISHGVTALHSETISNHYIHYSTEVCKYLSTSLSVSKILQDVSFRMLSFPLQGNGVNFSQIVHHT